MKKEDSAKRKNEISVETTIKKKMKNKQEDVACHSDESQDVMDETEKEVQEVFENQQFPTKKVSNKKSKKTKAVEEDDTNEPKEVAKDSAIDYLNLWVENRKEWKFKKVRQTWLLQNMYEKEKVSKENFKLLLDYLEDLKGLSRTTTLEQARKIVEEDKDAGKRKLKRATKVLRLLCDP